MAKIQKSWSYTLVHHAAVLSISLSILEKVSAVFCSILTRLAPITFMSLFRLIHSAWLEKYEYFRLYLQILEVFP